MNCNSKAFDILTEESAYWIGFIAADGCLSTKYNGGIKGLSIKLQHSDVGHLIKFQKFLSTKYAVISNDKFARIQVYDNLIYDKLIQYGLCENKTNCDYRISDEILYNKHFWRGMIDGDGSLGIYKNRNTTYVRLNLVSNTYLILLQFRLFINKYIGILPNILNRSNCSSMDINLTSKNAVNILNILYKDSSIYLDRKYNKYLEILNTCVVQPAETKVLKTL